MTKVIRFSLIKKSRFGSFVLGMDEIVNPTDWDLELRELAREEFGQRQYAGSLLFYRHIKNHALLEDSDHEIIAFCKEQVTAK